MATNNLYNKKYKRITPGRAAASEAERVVEAREGIGRAARTTRVREPKGLPSAEQIRSATVLRRQAVLRVLAKDVAAETLTGFSEDFKVKS